MKKIVLLMFCLLACFVSTNAQTVTKTTHKKALKTDVVTTGTLTVRKPSYVCISTDNDRDQLFMDGTKFTMTMGKKKHVTDSRRNPMFATFQSVLEAVINGRPIPSGEDLTVLTKGNEKTITIIPTGKKRQMFTSFVLVIDTKTSTFKTLRMNDRSGGYMEYTFKK
ncbi:MAG: outer membrane lipoprotein carrier protein LolA [Prevotella sp.]|nr:outer membrane lipoprotein carrier protein LolA [Prevotella sp.]